LTDEFYMRRALRLARRGEGWVSPNPLVGAVLVREDRIIGAGYHRRFGDAHAEINALRQAQEPVQGATVYVTLEPCSHFGKTPPCVEALIASRPARVVIGTADPNPLVAGRGIEALRAAGIATTLGILAKECRELNERFFKFMTSGAPFVTIKVAQTLDGRVATTTGHSRWISSPAARKFAHRLRSIHDAILVGSGTVLADDPELTVRHVRGRNPLRLIVDSRLKLPLTAKVFTRQSEARTIVAATDRADREKRKLLKDRGIETLLIAADDNGRVDMGKLFQELGKRQISSIFVEGGPAIVTSLLKEKLADRLVIIVAPKILGQGIDAVGDLGNVYMEEATKIDVRRVYRKGGDIVIDGSPGK